MLTAFTQVEFPDAARSRVFSRRGDLNSSSHDFQETRTHFGSLKSFSPAVKLNFSSAGVAVWMVERCFRSREPCFRCERSGSLFECANSSSCWSLDVGFVVSECLNDRLWLFVCEALPPLQRFPVRT